MDTHLGCNWPDEHELAPPLTLCYGTGSGQLSGSLRSLAPTVGPTLLGDLNRGVLPHCIALRLCCGCPRSLTTALTAVLPLFFCISFARRVRTASFSSFLMNSEEVEVGGLDLMGGGRVRLTTTSTCDNKHFTRTQINTNGSGQRQPPDKAPYSLRGGRVKLTTTSTCDNMHLGACDVYL